MLLCYPIKRAEYSFHPAGLMQIKQFIHRKEHTLPLRFLYSMQSTHREREQWRVVLESTKSSMAVFVFQQIVAGRLEDEVGVGLPVLCSE
jgi:hypothetical protein